MIHTARSTGKFMRLVRWLRQKLPQCPVDYETVAVGLLERLWHFTMTSHRRGDIGASDNEIIAEAVGWYGNPDELIAHLVEAAWLTEDKEHRLIIHDWHEHAPTHIKKNAHRWGGLLGQTSSHEKEKKLSEPFSPVKTAHDDLTEKPVSHLDSTPNLTKPNLTKPNLTSPLPPVGEDTSTPASIIAAEWNIHSGCTPVKKISPARARLAATRWKDSWWRENWREALDRIHNSPFHQGKNDRGWKATIDWFLKPDSVLKLLERDEKPKTADDGFFDNLKAFAAEDDIPELQESEVPF